MKLKSENFIAPLTYLFISILAMLKLILTPGVVSQGDWGIPLTESTALHAFYSGFYIWQLYGFGSPGSGFFYFNFLYPIFSPLGFYGAGMVKSLSVAFMFLSGTGMYFFVRDQGVGKLGSFMSGLVYMLSPMILDQLVYGWINYLTGYTLLPFFLLSLSKYIKKGEIRFMLIAGVIEAFALWRPTEIVTYPLLALVYSLISTGRKRGIFFTIFSTALALASNAYYFFPLSFSSTLQGAASFASSYGSIAQYHRIAYLPVLFRLGGLYMNSIYASYFTSWSYPFLYLILMFVPLGVVLNWRNRNVYFFLVSYFLILLAYFVYENYKFIIYHVPYGVIFEGLNPLFFPGAIGLAGLVGYTFDYITKKINRIKANKKFYGLLAVSFFIISAWAYPWWTGQFIGPQSSGVPQRISLYSIPKSYIDWNREVNATRGFVLYYPSGGYVVLQYKNSTHAVSGTIFYTNTIPALSTYASTLITYWIITKTYNTSQMLQQLGIRYYVIYKDVQSIYDLATIENSLNQSDGVKLVMNNPSIAVYIVDNASPLIFSNSTYRVVSSSPTSYELQVKASGPAIIILLQSYDKGWVAYANGTELLNEQYVIYGFPFNSWVIKHPGTYTVKIFYEPQELYMFYLGLSLSAFFGSLIAAIILSFIKKDMKKVK